MKRISVLAIVIVFCFCNVGISRFYYSYSRYRAHWSPYAHGLMCGSIKYSPYAKSIGTTGLIPSEFRYNPYASGIGKTGLVSTLSCYAVTSCNTGSCVCSQSPNIVEVSQNSSSSYSYTRIRASGTNKNSDDFTPGGQTAISAYLNAKGLEYRTDRLLRVQGMLVSVNYLLKDSNILIKYWNPEAQLAIQTKNRIIQREYQKYVDSWQQYSQQILEQGGRILAIESSDNTEIMAKLIENEKLICDVQFVYAKN